MKKKGMAFLCILALLSCPGCQMEQRTVSTGTQETDVYQVTAVSEVDYEKLSKALLGMTLEECKEAGGTLVEEMIEDDDESFKSQRFDVENDRHKLSSIRSMEDPYSFTSCGEYYYREDYAGSAYQNALWDEGTTGEPDPVILNKQRRKYPEEQIDSCSRDEAVRKCQDVADALGYGDASVYAYAMTADTLNVMYDMTSACGRPWKDYLVKKPKLGLVANEVQKEWTKEYEALMLTYYQTVDGTEVNGSGADLTVIYSPRYGRIVYAAWELPYQVKKTGEKETVISEEDAKKTVMQEYGLPTEESMEVDDIQRVYAVTYPETMMGSGHRLVPAWRIDFHKAAASAQSGPNAYKTALVNGLNGKICSFTAAG